MGKINAVELKDILNTTTKKMKSENDNIEINTIVENLITKVIGSEFASLWIFNESKALLLRERGEGSVREISMLGQKGVLAKCFLTLTGGIYNYLASEKEYLPSTDNPDDIRMKSKIIIPMLDGDRLLGIVTAYSSVKKIKNFTDGDKEILETMVPFLNNAIYQMYPDMKENASERVYIGERLLEESRSIVKKVEKIQDVEKTTKKPDEILSFVTNTVHDIRTPANTLYGFLELLEDQLDNPRLLQYIINARESAQYINDLTTSILDRVSTQRERTESKAVQVSPLKLFGNIAASFSANMFDKGIDFNVYIDPNIVKEITIEDVMLKRILMNLISNAYKFTPSKKTIEFTVLYKSSTNRLHISITDTGIGIAKEKQNKIFEAFTQAEDDTHANYGGTGLGLSISAQYVKDLGGKLKLESELDVGSTFSFDIPVEVSDKNEAFKPIKDSTVNLGILMNEENIFSVKNITRYLTGMGLKKESITTVKNISTTPKGMTHLICFQNQLTDKVTALTQDKKINLLVVEESFLSLLDDTDKESFNIISQYTFYGNSLHKFLLNKARKKILVVDDDPINIKLIKAILEGSFCHIDTAMDGLTALDMLENGIKQGGEPYSIVYLDQYMPELTGTEVISKFRTAEKKANVNPVFAVSISGDVQDISKQDGLFNSYIGKPFNSKKIKQTLEDTI